MARKVNTTLEDLELNELMNNKVIFKFHYKKIEAKKDDIKLITYDDVKDIYIVRYNNGKIIEASNVEQNDKKDGYIFAICVVDD